MSEIEKITATKLATSIDLESKKMPDIVDVKRFLDAVVTSGVKPQDYAEVMNAYRLAQLYGKNITLDSLAELLSFILKAKLEESQKIPMNVLIDNLKNLIKGISHITKVERHILVSIFVGFIISSIEQNS